MKCFCRNNVFWVMISSSYKLSQRFSKVQPRTKTLYNIVTRPTLFMIQKFPFSINSFLKGNIFAIAIIYKATWRFLIQLLNLVKATFFSLSFSPLSTHRQYYRNDAARKNDDRSSKWNSLTVWTIEHPVTKRNTNSGTLSSLRILFP